MAYEILKDIGKTLIGRGEEVKFRKEVEKHAADNGVSIEDAQKTIFKKRLEAYSRELNVSPDLVAAKELRGALQQIFTVEQLQQFKTLAENPAIFRALILPPVGTKEVSAVNRRYKAKFDGKVPSTREVLRIAENQQALVEVLRRFKGDRRLSGTGGLESILAANPELAADIGKIVAAMELIDKQEKSFDKSLKFNKAMDGFKADAKESLTTMFWKGPIDYISALQKGINGLSLESCVNLFGATMKFLGKEVWAGGKLLVSAGNALYRGVEKVRARV
jgi:hypothetical protein